MKVACGLIRKPVTVSIVAEGLFLIFKRSKIAFTGRYSCLPSIRAGTLKLPTCLTFRKISIMSYLGSSLALQIRGIHKANNRI
jgi:hypothetical protein